MNRECPSCARSSIPVKELLFTDYRCAECRELVGVQSIVAAISSFLIFVVASVTTLVVLIELGLYGALVWFTAPVGALGYLKARFGPLETKTIL